MNIESPVLAERFWSKVKVGKRLACWPWGGARDELGYGKLTQGGKADRAPRVAYFLRNGVWPKNACHSCDNPICCNPGHIFDGTHADNMRDMMVKDRHRSIAGERHGRAVLNNKSVLKIRSDYKSGGKTMTNLAVKFNVSFATIQRIIKRTTWRHL